MKRELCHEILPGPQPASSGYYDHRRDIGATTLGANLEKSWRRQARPDAARLATAAPCRHRFLLLRHTGRRNVMAGPAAVTIGRRTFPVVPEVLDPDRAAVLAGYEARNAWMRPVVRRVLSNLSGLDYDG